MTIWLALIIPVLVGVGMMVLFKKKVTWWEIITPIFITALVIVIAKLSVESSLVRDTEYWGNYLVEAQYYEDWNEYVYATCPEDYVCGTDEDGNTKMCTRWVDCSYVDYHPEHWTAIDNSGEEFSISEKQYAEFSKRFKNNSFTELQRNYHTDDGDMYSTKWNNDPATFEYIATKHVYENKIPVSTSTYNYPDPSDSDIVRYDLYEYPDIAYWHKLSGILAPKDYYIPKSAYHKMDLLNGKLGMKKEVRVWIQIFEDQPLAAAHIQEALWEGGNKNEICIAIGVSDTAVSWCHVYSWSESEALMTDIRYFINSQKSLDLDGLIDYLYPAVEEKYVRRNFDDFSYLSIELPMSVTIWVMILSLALSLFFGFWAVRNEFDADGTNYDY